MTPINEVVESVLSEEVIKYIHGFDETDLMVLALAGANFIVRTLKLTSEQAIARIELIRVNREEYLEKSGLYLPK